MASGDVILDVIGARPSRELEDGSNVEFTLKVTNQGVEQFAADFFSSPSFLGWPTAEALPQFGKQYRVTITEV